MSYSYRLKSHADIGYDKFFDTFREEYNARSRSTKAYDFVDSKLSQYNARLDRKLNDGTLIFNTEADFLMFAVRWS